MQRQKVKGDDPLIGRVGADLSVALRPATAADAERVFRWRNLPEIRALGTDTEPIPWERHVAFFERVLEGRDTLLLIVEEGGVPAGQVRFDWVEDGWALVSIYLEPGREGRGVGTAALADGCARALAARETRGVVALVRAENERSIRSFRKVGFAEDAGAPIQTPSGHVRLVLVP